MLCFIKWFIIYLPDIISEVFLFFQWFWNAVPKREKPQVLLYHSSESGLWKGPSLTMTKKKKKRWSNTVQCFLTITCASLHKPRCVRTGRARCGLYQRRFLSSVTVIWRWLMMELPSLSHVAPWPHWQGQMVITPCVLCSKPQMEWTWRLWHGYDCVLVTAGEVPGWQWRSCWTAVSTTWTFWSQSRTTAG